MLTLNELWNEAEAGAIDTVVVAFTGVAGRLLGKRMRAEFFLEDTVAHGVELSNSLLALGAEPAPLRDASRLLPDFSTLRRLPWLDGTALVLCDPVGDDDEPVRTSPRRVLKAQVERAESRGFAPAFASQLEFYVLEDSYEEARTKRYRDLTPSVPYGVGYDIRATTSDEPFLRGVRNGAHGAGVGVESTNGGAWPGQHEIALAVSDAVALADSHVVFKHAAKEIAHMSGRSVTFMAQPDDAWLGSSCRIRASLSRLDDPAVTDDAVVGAWLAGWIEHANELAIFLAPNGNSYRRHAAEQVSRPASSDDAAGYGFGVVRRGSSGRAETRLPGSDVNPYLALAALIAAGLDGIERGLEPPPSLEARFPHTLNEATAALERGTFARAALGDEVVTHYLDHARAEQRRHDGVTACDERERLFEHA